MIPISTTGGAERISTAPILSACLTISQINCVIVKDLSRFGRNYVEAGRFLETVFPLYGVRFIAINDQIDSIANPQSANNIIVPFKNIINDEYCRDISMKVRSALDIRRKQGKFIGSFAAYGYKKDENDRNKLVVDDRAAETVKLIFKKFLDGYSIIGIARELNERGISNPSHYRKQSTGGLWVDSTVRRILTNELYIGNLVQKKNETVSYKLHKSQKVDEGRRITVKNTHEAIISEEDFYKVQNLLKRDTRTSPYVGKLSVFSGFVKCADCERAMQKRVVKQKNKTYEYYVCSTYKKLHKCTKHAVRADILESTVLTFLNEYIRIAVDFDRAVERMSAEEKNRRRTDALNAELEANKRELLKAQNILTDLYPDYKNGVIGKEQYLALKERYENKSEALKSTIVRLSEEVTKGSVNLGNAFIERFKKYRGLKELSRSVVIELIENIYVHGDGTIEIHLKCKDELIKAKEYLLQNKTGDKKIV